MANLMNVNNQAMPMGDNTGASGDGQTGPRRHFKHIGELVDGGAKVVIMYRTVPDEPNNCLVVGTKFLPSIRQNIGQNKPTALSPPFITFSQNSKLRNLAVWMMRISHSGSKLKTDYDYFVIIPLICWS